MFIERNPCNFAKRLERRKISKYFKEVKRGRLNAIHHVAMHIADWFFCL